MAITTIRRLAADIMNVGESRIKIAPESLKEASGALTRADVRGLIDKGIIRKVPLLGRASTRKRSRRGAAHTRGKLITDKEAWMERVRAQRRFLKQVISDGALPKEHKNAIYGKIKSGIFRNKRTMLLYLKDNRLVAADYEPKKPVFVKPQVTRQATGAAPNQSTSRTVPIEKMHEKAGARTTKEGTSREK